MRSVSTTATVLTAALLAVTGGTAMAAPVDVTVQHASTKAVAAHATRGVVRSLDSSTLVITRAGVRRGEMTFALDTTTQREGTLAVGTPVSVRYREDGKRHIATAIRALPDKQQKAHAARPKR